METVMRDYPKEKEGVYDVLLQIRRDRVRKDKDNRIFLADVVEASGLDLEAVANALKWMKRKGLAHTKDGKDGWFVDPMHPATRPRFCWRHGLLRQVEGRGKNKKVFCPICGRNPKEEENGGEEKSGADENPGQKRRRSAGQN